MSRNPIPASNVEHVHRRDSWTCQAPYWDRTLSTHDCAPGIEIHHRKPKGMGGTSDPAIHDVGNLLVLCQHHHAWVHAHPAVSYDSGLLIHR